MIALRELEKAEDTVHDYLIQHKEARVLSPLAIAILCDAFDLGFHQDAPVEAHVSEHHGTKNIHFQERIIWGNSIELHATTRRIPKTIVILGERRSVRSPIKIA